MLSVNRVTEQALADEGNGVPRQAEQQQCVCVCVCFWLKLAQALVQGTHPRLGGEGWGTYQATLFIPDSALLVPQLSPLRNPALASLRG